MTARLTEDPPPESGDRLLLCLTSDEELARAREAAAIIETPVATCADIDRLCHEMTQGAGAVLIDEESLDREAADALAAALALQPAWSEMPVVVIRSRTADAPGSERALQLPSDVTLLERPVSPTILVAMLRSALKSRRRQYLLRDRMAELEASEEILLQTEVRVQMAAEAAMIGFWQWDYDRSRLATDQRFREIFGFSRDSIPPASAFLERVPAVDRDDLLTEIETQLRRHDRFTLETRINRADGRPRWIYAAGSRTPPRSDGTAARINGLCMDISTRKEVEEELRRQASLLDLTHDAIIVRSGDCRVMYWNRGAEEMYGWTSDEVAGQVTHELFHAAYPRPLPDLLQQLRETGRWEGEAVHTTKTGTQVTVLARWALQAEAGEVRVLEINTDISARKRVERHIEETRRHLQTIIDTAPIPIAYLDRDMRYLFANELYVRLRFEHGADFRGRSVAEMLPAADYEKVKASLSQAAEGMSASFETELLDRGDQVMRHYIVAYAPDLDASHDVRGIVMALSDITSMKEAQASLATAKEAAEAASRAKSQFLANMSHEMRTPLAGVLGMIDLVLEMDLGEEQRRLLDMAHHSADSLLRLIADILDYSALEAGKLSFQPRPFPIRDLIGSIISFFSVDAAKRGLLLRGEVDERLPEAMTADEGRLRQVLVNLVGNAVKFTLRGQVTVTADIPDGQPETIRFSVLDTGIGIPAEQTPRLFQLFSQLDASSTRRFGGTGLGLALSREIVQQMGGDIAVTSRVGEGSTFTVTLPLVQ